MSTSGPPYDPLLGANDDDLFGDLNQDYGNQDFPDFYFDPNSMGTDLPDFDMDPTMFPEFLQQSPTRAEPAGPILVSPKSTRRRSSQRIQEQQQQQQQQQQQLALPTLPRASFALPAAPPAQTGLTLPQAPSLPSYPAPPSGGNQYYTSDFDLGPANPLYSGRPEPVRTRPQQPQQPQQPVRPAGRPQRPQFPNPLPVSRPQQLVRPAALPQLQLPQYPPPPGGYHGGLSLPVNTLPPPPSPLPEAQTPDFASPMSSGEENGKKIIHNRKAKHRPDNDPSIMYPRLPAQIAWGPPKGRAKAKTFEYFKGGPELYPNRRFSKDELWAFFLGVGRPTPRQLTLWIQHTPAQVNDRYQANSASSKCRWKDCPVPQGTILKGFYRVAMDELSDLTSSGAADPFHNAGYLHLYCFEAMFDLGLLLYTAHAFYGFKVRVDTRQLKRESRNPMSITRDYDELQTTFASWKQTHQPRASAIWAHAQDPDVGGRHPPPPDTTSPKSRLWYALTTCHLKLEDKGRQTSRQQRGGANIQAHRGDLLRFLAIKDDMKHKARTKRAAPDDDDDDAAAQAPDSPRNNVRLSWSSSSSSAATSAPSPRKRPRPNPKPINTAAAAAHRDAEAEFHPNDDWMHQPAPPPPQGHSPADELHRLATDPARPATRKRSREVAEAIVNVVATTPRITRQQTSEISGVLAQQPAYVRERVLAAVAPAGSPIRPVFDEVVLYDDGLEERVGRLPKRPRREVDVVVAKKEQGGDPRRNHTVV